MSLMTVQALREVSVMRLREVSVMRPGNNPCSTVQALRGVVFDQAVLLLPCWTNNHCPRLGLNVVIKHYWHSFPPGRQAMFPLSCARARTHDFSARAHSIYLLIKGRHNSITLCTIDRTDYH